MWANCVMSDMLLAFVSSHKDCQNSHLVLAPSTMLQPSRLSIHTADAHNGGDGAS